MLFSFSDYIINPINLYQTNIIAKNYEKYANILEKFTNKGYNTKISEEIKKQTKVGNA